MDGWFWRHGVCRRAGVRIVYGECPYPSSTWPGRGKPDMMVTRKPRYSELILSLSRNLLLLPSSLIPTPTPNPQDPSLIKDHVPYPSFLIQGLSPPSLVLDCMSYPCPTRSLQFMPCPHTQPSSLHSLASLTPQCLSPAHPVRLSPSLAAHPIHLPPMQPPRRPRSARSARSLTNRQSNTATPTKMSEIHQSTTLSVDFQMSK